MQELLDIKTLLERGRFKKMDAAVQSALDAEIPAADILNKALIPGMDVVGDRFKNDEIFLPEVMMSARAMSAATEKLKPYLQTDSAQKIGTVILGTVKDDQHDIGKNLVKIMMEGKGITVVDLGVNVDSDTFLSAAKENDAKVICCSVLLTTSLDYLDEIAEKIRQEGLSEKIKLMVGGAAVTKEYAERIGADAYSADAASAAELAAQFCGA